MSMIACDSCDAFNASKASVCIECGEPLGAGDALRSGAGAPVPPPLHEVQAKGPLPPALPDGRAKALQGRTSRQQRDPEEAERSRQRREFGRIKIIVFTMRSVYWSGIIFAVAQLLLYHLILLPAFVELELKALQVIVGVISWGQLAVVIAGAKLVVRKPYVWTLVGAAYWTLCTAQAFWVASLADWALLQDTRFTAYLKMMVFMLGAFWFAVGQAKRVERLMDANPDLQLQRKRLDPEDLSYGGIAEEASARHTAERKRSHSMQLRLVLVGVGVLLLGGGGVWAMTRPPSPESAAQTFKEHWQAKELDKIYLLCIGGKGGVAGMALHKGLDQRGWDQDLPELGDVEVNGSEKRATCLFACADGELAVKWRLSESSWRIHSASLPDLVVGDIHEGVAAFQKAWASSGLHAISAMIRPESLRIRRGVTNILKGREWVESRPRLGDAQIGELRSRGRVYVVFDVGSVRMRITLQFWHPGWQIAGFSLN